MMSIEGNKVVPLVNIFNKQTGQRFIGSRQGIFKLNISSADSLVFTAIGYEPLQFMGKDLLPDNPDDTIKLFMRPTAYQLKDVTVVFGNSRRDSLARLAAEYLKTDPLMNNYDRVLNRDKGGLMSPLTAIWNEYSKSGQEMKKFEEMLRHAELLKQVDARYNKKTIKRATGLDDAYLDDYILFCKMDRTFILTSSDYELVLAMRDCAKRFRLVKGIED